jgi:hypothetical protein
VIARSTRLAANRSPNRGQISELLYEAGPGRYPLATGVVTTEEVGEVEQRRILQGFSVAILGVALACAPMTIASAHKAKHHKTKHHTTAKATTKGANPGSSLCLAIANAESSSGNVGTAIEKAIEQGATSGNFAEAKTAMIAAINDSLKEEGPAEAALRSAPANVQAAMKGLFSFVNSYKTAIANASSFTQLETSIVSIAESSQVKTDSVTLANYVTSQCGSTTTTT